MSYSWSVPKTLARTNKLSLREKMVIAVCLQYYNAGYPNNASKTNIKDALGYSRRTLEIAIRNLVSKNLLADPSSINYGEDSVILLNHKELLSQKLLIAQNYKTLPLE